MEKIDLIPLSIKQLTDMMVSSYHSHQYNEVKAEIKRKKAQLEAKIRLNSEY